MEYVYAAMLLHSAEKDIDEDGVSSVLSAAGVEVDGARVKALVTSLGDVDIGEAMATAVAAPVAAAPATAGGGGGKDAPAAEEIMKYLIIGLGNPGAEYENTRHNIGFRFIDELISKLIKRLSYQFCVPPLYGSTI